MNYDLIKTELLIDCLPQNQPLYKDSGLWQIRTDSMEDVVLQQRVDESFRDFIIRYVTILEGNYDVVSDLYLAITMENIKQQEANEK